MTDEKMKELISEYKKLKSLLKVDQSLQKQGVWGFIPSENLPNICKFVETFEQCETIAFAIGLGRMKAIDTNRFDLDDLFGEAYLKFIHTYRKACK